MVGKIIDYGDSFVVVENNRAYAFSFTSGFVIKDSIKKDEKSLIDALRAANGYVRKNKSITIKNGSTKRIIEYNPEFGKKVNGIIFFKSGRKYKTIIDGAEVFTEGFDGFVVKSGIGPIGVRTIDGAREVIGKLKGVETHSIRAVEPHFNRYPGARFHIKYGNVSVDALGKIIGDELRLYRVPWKDGIYDFTVPINDLERLFEAPENFARRIIVKVNVGKIIKISTPRYRPGTAMYSGECGRAYVSLDGKKYYINGKWYDINSGEVNLCRLRK